MLNLNFRRKKLTSFARTTFVALVIIAALAAGWAYRDHHRYKHFAIHDLNRIYRSAWLEPDVMAEIVHRHGLRTVVNLCNPGEMGHERWVAERTAVENAGARFVELPMSLEISSDERLVLPHVALLNETHNCVPYAR